MTKVIIKNTILFSIISIFTTACLFDNGANNTEDLKDEALTDETVAPRVVQLSGVIQKGPLILGSSIQIQELNTSLSPTGKVFNTETKDDFGNFSLAPELEENYAGIEATGYYFDEISGTKSASTLTLRTTSDVTSDRSIKINLLTNLANNRVKHLVTTDGLSFDEALPKAQTEILEIFGINQKLFTDAGQTYNIANFDEMDISETGNSNAILLAVSSTLLQVAHTRDANAIPAELSSIMASINTDIETDGVLDSASIKAEIVAGSKDVDASAVRLNLEARFEKLGKTVTVASFEDFLDDDGDGVLNLLDFSLDFPAKTASTLGEYVTSDAKTVTLVVGSTATANTDKGTIVLNGVDTGVKTHTVVDGDTIAIRLQAPTSHLGTTTNNTATITVGSVTGSFVIGISYFQPQKTAEISSVNIYNMMMSSVIQTATHETSDGKVFSLITGMNENNISSTSELEIHNITDPVNPVLVTSIDISTSSANGTRILAINGNHMAVAFYDPASYISIFDISNPSTGVTLIETFVTSFPPESAAIDSANQVIYYVGPSASAGLSAYRYDSTSSWAAGNYDIVSDTNFKCLDSGSDQTGDTGFCKPRKIVLNAAKTKAYIAMTHKDIAVLDIGGTFSSSTPASTFTFTFNRQINNGLDSVGVSTDNSSFNNVFLSPDENTLIGLDNSKVYGFDLTDDSVSFEYTLPTGQSTTIRKLSDDGTRLYHSYTDADGYPVFAIMSLASGIEIGQYKGAQYHNNISFAVTPDESIAVILYTDSANDFTHVLKLKP